MNLYINHKKLNFKNILKLYFLAYVIKLIRIFNSEFKILKYFIMIIQIQTGMGNIINKGNYIWFDHFFKQ